MKLPSSTSALLDWFYPPDCAICATSLRRGRNLCPPCASKLFRLPTNACRTCAQWFDGDFPPPKSCQNCKSLRPAFDFATSALRASDANLELIHQFKLEGRPELGGDLAALCEPAFRKDHRLADLTNPLLIPVPLHSARMRQRKFNQALEIAKPLAKLLDLTVLQALKRVRDTERQATLTRNQRLTNLHKAFRLHLDPTKITGRNLILIDDVFTTGSTAQACAKVLKQAKPASIAVFTVMRA